MRRPVVLIALVCNLTGCATHKALQNDTARTTNTLTDLQYQQVLDNVARFHACPDSIPSLAVTNSGTVSVNDQAGGGFSPTYSPTLSTATQLAGSPAILSLLFPITASRGVTENWSLTPVTDADNLRRLRCAYRLLVLGEAAPNYEFCRKQIKEFFSGEEAELADSFPPRAWYGVGGKKDVPACASYVGRHCDTYVWVEPAGMNSLAVFTMGLLDLATGKQRTPQRTVVRTYKGEAKLENLVETKVTVTEDDDDALKAIREGRTRPPARSRAVAPFNPGLLFAVPRQ